MERREERLEKCREPIGLRLECRGRAMQTRAPPIRLLELVAKKSIAFEQAINRITLHVLQLPCGNELFAVDGESGAHPICRQRTARPVNENKTGDLPVGRKNFECSIRTQPPGEVLRQTKRKMRLRKLKLDSRFAVNPAWFDPLHSKIFLRRKSGQCQRERRHLPSCQLSVDRSAIWEQSDGHRAVQDE